MDALARLEPVARDLVHRVDTALVTLGAPADHPVWPLLRRLGVTPADAVRFVVETDPTPLRATAAALRDRAEAYEATELPADLPWRGAAGETYAEQAAGLRAHLGELAGRLRATAAYADDVADWSARSRERLARALADVLTSAQAVTVRTGTSPAPAAADIGVRLLGAVAEAVAEGTDGHRRWASELGELPYECSPTGADPPRWNGTVEVPRA